MTARSPYFAARAIAIDVASRSFGYAVFEGPARLIDWAVPSVFGDKKAVTLRKIMALVSQYRPMILVVEDTGERRAERVRELIDELARRGREWGLDVAFVSAREARVAVLGDPRGTKQSIAKRLAEYYPELETSLPRPRKPWMPEQRKINLFDAVAFGFTYFRRKSGDDLDTISF